MDSDNALCAHCPRSRTQRSRSILCSRALNMASFRNCASPDGEARDHHRSSPGVARAESKAGQRGAPQIIDQSDGGVVAEILVMSHARAFGARGCRTTSAGELQLRPSTLRALIPLPIRCSHGGNRFPGEESGPSAIRPGSRTRTVDRRCPSYLVVTTMDTHLRIARSLAFSHS